MNKDSFLGLKELLTEKVRAASQEAFQVTLNDVNAEVPPRAAMGDLAFPVAFELAKRIKQATGEKRAPRVIAEQLAKALEEVEGVARVEVAGAGYLNLFFDRAGLLAGFVTEKDAETAASPDTRLKRM